MSFVQGETPGQAEDCKARLPRTIANRIFDHIRQNADLEACGLIAAADGIPMRCLPIANVAADPAHRYRMDPNALVRGLYELEAAGETLFAIYHSHPAGPAAPSAIDIAEASCPDTLYLIVSLGTRGVMEMRGFRIADGRAVEVELEIG